MLALTQFVFKGLLPPDYETSFKGVWKYATVDDVAEAAKDWPEMNFVIYHAALRPFLELPIKLGKSLKKVRVYKMGIRFGKNSSRTWSNKCIW